MLTWHLITSDEFYNSDDSLKSEDKVIFLKDTKELYRGTIPFTESVILYDELPGDDEPKALNRLYINRSTLEGKVWDKTKWTTVIAPITDSLDTTDTFNPVSGKAVTDYVTDYVTNYVSKSIGDATTAGDIVSDVSYDRFKNAIVLKMSDNTTKDIPLSGVAIDIKYNQATGELQIKNIAGEALGSINLDLERFVSESIYDADNKKIILKFNDDSSPLEIDVKDLVDTYGVTNTSTIQLSMSNNTISANVIVSNETDNQLIKKDSGLYVAPTDLSSKIDRVQPMTEDEVLDNNIALLTTDGSVKNSKVRIGAATLATTPSATTVTTEAAVKEVVDNLEEIINGKMTKVGEGHTNEVIIASDVGDAIASGYKTGGTRFSTTNGDKLLATESGVTAHVQDKTIPKINIVTAGNVSATTDAASDSKVLSEKAFVDSISWKTTL